MKIIKEPYIEGQTTVTQVLYKGNKWERRENKKVIHWFLFNDYENESSKIFTYQYSLLTNKWVTYIDDLTSPQNIDMPHIEFKYLLCKGFICLYSFCLSHFAGQVEGLFIANKNDVDKLIGKDIRDEDECIFTIEDHHITKLYVRSETIEDLLKHFPSMTISGINPLEHLKDN